MQDSYKKLLELYKSCRKDYFVMAIAAVLDMGWTSAQSITEDDIKNVEANGLMTKEFNEWILKTVKKITETAGSAIEVVQFCMAEDIFETRYYADKLSRSELENMLKYRISFEGKSVEDAKNTEYFEEYYGCNLEDFEYLGYKIPEEE